jgi:hypothetical protein
VLRVFGDFRAITVVQHFLGLVTGIMLLLTWRRARVFTPNPRVSRAAYEGLGLLAAAIFLLATEPTRFETQLRPESICGVSNQPQSVLRRSVHGLLFCRTPNESGVGYGIAAVVSSILLASVKPSFALVAMFALLPTGLFFLQRGWFRQKVALAAGAPVSAALLLLPERSLSRNDEASQTFLPATLFVIHANLIRDQMAEDFASQTTAPYSQEWLARIHASLGAETAKSHTASPRHYPSLGLDPDYLMFHPNSIVAQLRREFENDVPGLCSFYRSFYARIWRQRPTRILQKVFQQMAVFYTPVCPAYDRRRSWRLADEYGYSLMLLGLKPYGQNLAAYPPGVDFVDRTESLSRSAPVVLQPRPIQGLLFLFGAIYRREQFGWCRFGFVRIILQRDQCVGVAIVNSLEIRRYMTVQLFPVIVAQFLALWFVIELFLERRARGKIPLQ